MTTNPYQVLGPSVPPMLGRVRFFKTLNDDLKDHHLSVVGPAYYGKSVLLNALAGIYRKGRGEYVTAAYVDLRRHTPFSDVDFMWRLSKEIRMALQPVRPELAEWIESDGENINEVVSIVFDELETKNERVLVVLDGFDYATAGTGLTQGLFDQLRDLAEKSSLRLVAGSRKTLFELCSPKNKNSPTSTFWQIFFERRVTTLDDADMDGFLHPLHDAGCEFEEPARKEITNWTGRVPVLLCALLHELWEQHRGETLSKCSIDGGAETVVSEHQQLLAALWDDCNDDLKSDLGMLTEEGHLRSNDLSETRSDELMERGFARKSRKGIMRSSCRLMQRYAKAQAPSVAVLDRLMGETLGFDAHIRSLLNHRLAQVSVPDVDDLLQESVALAIRDLTPDPQYAVGWVRRIVTRALNLIWNAELPPNRELPTDWRDEWDGIDGLKYDHNEGILPRAPGPQLKILRLAMGTEWRTEWGTARTSRRLRHISKTTHLLVDHLHSVGNFGQHIEEHPETTVTIGFAAAVVFAAISLVECLTQDLKGTDAV